MIRDFRAYTACTCILVPNFFHCVQSLATSRAGYDSVSLELFPIYSCDRHNVPVIVTTPLPATHVNSPRRLVKFVKKPCVSDFSVRSANFATRNTSDHQSVETSSVPAILGGSTVFKNSPFVLPRGSGSSSAQFRNSS